jgi:hypothetical protein
VTPEASTQPEPPAGAWEPELPFESPAAEESRRTPAFSFLLGAGPVVGWFYGGQLMLGASIRLANHLYLALQLHGGGGGQTDGDNAFVTGIGELNLRIESWNGFGGVAHFGFGTAYLGEFEDGLDYEYAAPHASLGGGFMLASSGRFAFGVEGTLRIGYAINTYNYYCSSEGFDPSLCVDYGGVYAALEVMAVLHL